jgi:CRISPR-associated protein GSU0053 (Cas_GSU0053)
MDYTALTRAVEEDAALRRRQILQPVGGKNDKIFPPTYPEERRGQGPRHVFERRRLNGREAWCVLVDSVQSQANRLEEALLAALRQGVITMPHVSVDFRGAGLVGITEITSLDAPTGSSGRNAGKRRGCRRRRAGMTERSPIRPVAGSFGGTNTVAGVRANPLLAATSGAGCASNHSRARRSSARSPRALQVATRAENTRSGCGGHSGATFA